MVSMLSFHSNSTHSQLIFACHLDNIMNDVQNQVEVLARDGLRTLVFADRIIPFDQYQQFHRYAEIRDAKGSAAISSVWTTEGCVMHRKIGGASSLFHSRKVPYVL